MKEIIDTTPDNTTRRETPDSVASPSASAGGTGETYEVKRGGSTIVSYQDSSQSTSLYEDPGVGSGGMESEIF